MNNQICPYEQQLFNSTGVCPVDSFPSTDIRNEILHQFDFKNIVPGIPAFLRHVKTFMQYGISNAQKIFHKTFSNVTHAALVVNATDNEVCLVESIGDGVQEKCYSAEHLIKEELCFPAVRMDFLHDLTRDIAKKIFEKPSKYNLPGALGQPLIPKIFTFEQKKELINAAISYLVDANPANLKEAYFCSEFVMEVIQIAHFLKKNPQLKELVDQEMSLINPKIFVEKKRTTHQIMKKLDVDALWKSVAADPFFVAPAFAISPADLIEMYAGSNSIICASSSDPEASPCNSSHASETECLQYMAIPMLDRYFKGEEIPEDELQTFISALSKATSYSPETLRCFFQQLNRERCSNAALEESLPNIIEHCLTSTLSWREKINVFFVSCALSQAVGRLKQDPSLIDQLQSKDDAVMEAAAKAVFQINPLKSIHFVTNIFILMALQNKDPEYLYKYIPVGLLYDKSIFGKIGEIGIEKIYPILEKITSMDHRVFECWHKFCNPKLTMQCALQCSQPEKYASVAVATNIDRELKEIRKNPAEWVIQNIFNQKEPSKIFLKAHEMNEIESWRVLDPQDPSSYRKIFLPIALIAYVNENPENALTQISDLLSYDNVLGLLNHQEIINRSIDGAMLWYLGKSTSYNTNTLNCIRRDCGVLQTESLQECIERCVRSHLTEKEKKDFLKFKNKLDLMSDRIKEGGESIFPDGDIKVIQEIIQENSDFKELLFKNLPMYLAEDAERVKETLALSKNEWDEKSLKEKLILFLRFAYPETYRMIKLMNPENAMLVMKEAEIWKTIIDYIKNCLY